MGLVGASKEISKWTPYVSDGEGLLISLSKQMIILSPFPKNHPDKKKAWAAVRLAMQSLDQAANEIEPKFSS
jgi:hypothetical protein